ncbi:copine-8 [Anaeramoeba flamelloides]|uniref:Copine-8 n=1 Tax=Anaeramoeba flamelloides TaxID=1746091 RepID=A0ABQ8X8V4_9EUKA|nr:copine-8 [Anaeramoeba flamelloides]
MYTSVSLHFTFDLLITQNKPDLSNVQKGGFKVELFQDINSTTATEKPVLVDYVKYYRTEKGDLNNYIYEKFECTKSFRINVPTKKTKETEKEEKEKETETVHWRIYLENQWFKWESSTGFLKLGYYILSNEEILNNVGKCIKRKLIRYKTDNYPSNGVVYIYIEPLSISEGFEKKLRKEFEINQSTNLLAWSVTPKEKENENENKNEKEKEKENENENKNGLKKTKNKSKQKKWIKQDKDFRTTNILPYFPIKLKKTGFQSKLKSNNYKIHKQIRKKKKKQIHQLRFDKLVKIDQINNEKINLTIESFEIRKEKEEKEIKKVDKEEEKKLEIRKLMETYDLEEYSKIHFKKLKKTIKLRDSFVITFQLSDLAKMDKFGKSDPYLVIYREFEMSKMDLKERIAAFESPNYYNDYHEEGLNYKKYYKQLYKKRHPGRQWYPRDPKWLCIAISEMETNTLNTFLSAQIKSRDLINVETNVEQNLRIECWDWNKKGIHDYIGSCEIKYSELIDISERGNNQKNSNMSKSYELTNLEQKFKRKNYQHSGLLSIQNIETKYRDFDAKLILLEKYNQNARLVTKTRVLEKNVHSDKMFYLRNSSFVDYTQWGLDLQAYFGIDFYNCEPAIYETNLNFWFLKDPKGQFHKTKFVSILLQAFSNIKHSKEIESKINAVGIGVEKKENISKFYDNKELENSITPLPSGIGDIVSQVQSITQMKVTEPEKYGYHYENLPSNATYIIAYLLKNVEKQSLEQPNTVFPCFICISPRTSFYEQLSTSLQEYKKEIERLPIALFLCFPETNTNYSSVFGDNNSKYWKVIDYINTSSEMIDLTRIENDIKKWIGKKYKKYLKLKYL